MADDLVVETFKAARAQLERTARLHVIVLAALLYFHVGIVAPFGAKTAEQVAVRSDLVRQRELISAISPVSDLVQRLGDEVEMSARDMSGLLLSDLVARFRRLSDIVASLSTMSEEDAAGERGRELFSPPPIFQQQQQQQQQQQVVQSIQEGEDSSPRPMPPDLAVLVARHGNDPFGPDRFTAELESYIQEAVVQPAFDSVNALWEREHLQRIDSQVEAALSAIGTARTAMDGGQAELDEAEATVRRLAEQAHLLEFSAPPDPDCWRSVAGKEGSIAGMTRDLSERIADAAKARFDVAELQAAVTEAVSMEERASEAIAAELARLEDDAKALQTQLGEIGGALKAVSFRLAILAPLLPALIAFASGAATLLTADALRRMCLAVSLSDPDQRAKLQPWLADSAGRSGRRMTLRALAIGALMAAWILISVQVTHPLEPVLIPNMAIAALAFAFLGFCRLWLWRQSVEALRIADAPA